MPSLSRQVSALRSRQSHLQKLLGDPETFGITLLAILLDEYGVEALDWHPLTRRMELEQDFGVEVPVINGDKLSAASDILTSDAFFKEPSRFIQYCNILSGSHPAFGSFDPADADECAWGITEGLLIYPPEDDEEEPFSREIRFYLGKVLSDEGIKNPPDVLKIALFEDEPDFDDFDDENPGMFEAEFRTQSDEAAELEARLKARLKDCVAEFSAVPFKNPLPEDLTKTLTAWG